MCIRDRFVEKTPEGKALQRALLQYYEPRNAEKVVKALKMTHREAVSYTHLPVTFMKSRREIALLIFVLLLNTENIISNGGLHIPRCIQL